MRTDTIKFVPPVILIAKSSLVKVESIFISSKIIRRIVFMIPFMSKAPIIRSSTGILYSLWIFVLNVARFLTRTDSPTHSLCEEYTTCQGWIFPIHILLLQEFVQPKQAGSFYTKISCIIQIKVY